MKTLNETAELVSIELDHVELVGLCNAMVMGLNLLPSELQQFTGLQPEEAQALVHALEDVIIRMRQARDRSGLPW